MAAPLLTFDDLGIYCPQGDFYIDPWKPVKYAVITHAHADHSRWGMEHYLAHHDSVPVMRYRLGEDISVQSVAYGEVVNINGVKVSLHPAGHIIGSSQVRVEYKGQIWVASGDYKLGADRSCVEFEPVQCHAFITESTFGLPVYKWQEGDEIFEKMNAWWRKNAENGVVSIIYGYSLGKAQRIQMGLDPSIGPIFTHGAVENTNQILRENGLALPETIRVTKESKKADFKGGIVVAPPSANGTSWIRKFAPYSTGLASGWMALRGARRRRNVDQGFVLSDHADWPGLMQAIESTGAHHIFVTHGYTDIFSRYLREIGYDAHVVSTEYEGELSELGETAKETDEESEKKEETA